MNKSCWNILVRGTFFGQMYIDLSLLLANNWLLTSLGDNIKENRNGFCYICLSQTPSLTCFLRCFPLPLLMAHCVPIAYVDQCPGEMRVNFLGIMVMQWRKSFRAFLEPTLMVAVSKQFCRKGAKHLYVNEKCVISIGSINPSKNCQQPGKITKGLKYF